MKDLLIFFVFAFFLSDEIHAQQPSAQLLKEPASWSFEKFALPPEFAPDFPYKGVEELRFSPGMFDKDSSDYFTYAFAAALDNTTALSQNDIKNHLLKYFKGLCNSTAKQRNISIDTSKITVAIEKQKDAPGNETIYNALLNIFGVFADGTPVKLNTEIKVLKDEAAQKIYLVFIASPNKKSDAIWQQLYKIQKDFKIPEQ